MGRQWNTIIESLGPLTGGTMSINANLTEIEALLTTLQADVADGIVVTGGSTVVTGGTLGQLTSGTVTAIAHGINIGGTNNPMPLNVAESEENFANGRRLGVSIIASDGAEFGTDIPFSVSGTVTANPVRGTTTTGTLTAGTTNGTLFATNSTRNYLLVQCTSGTAFIDTNGTATAANGIQLTSGQGITFEGSFIPTGAIAAITSTGTAQLIGRQG